MDMTSVSHEDKEYFRSQRKNHMSSSISEVDKVFTSNIKLSVQKRKKINPIRINTTKLSLKLIRQLYWKTHLNHHQHPMTKKPPEIKIYVQVLVLD